MSSSRLGASCSALALALAACAAALPSCHHASPSATRTTDTAPLARATPVEAAVADAAPATGTAARNAAEDGGAASLLTLADEVANRVSALRGLAVRRPIERGVMDRQHVLQRMHERVREEYPPGEIDLEAEINRRLGLIPEGLDYERTVFDLLEEQVAGFYDPDERRLFIASWVPREMQVVTLAHEIDHALQDQHFDIARYTHHARGAGDAQNAAMAVVEGDATVAMLEFALAPAGRSVRDMPDVQRMFERQMLDTAGQPRLAAAPRAIRDMLLFPYRHGLALCARLYRETGNFDAVNALLRTSPPSTEQVLHADKLAAHEAPLVVPAAPLPALAADHALVFDDVEGEYGAQLFLQQGVADDVAAAAAAGWGGDRALLFVPRATGVVVGGGDAGTTLPAGALSESVLVWIVVFDRAAGAHPDAEAVEFERAALGVLARRYPQGAVRTLPGVSRALETAPGRVAAVARSGRAVVVLDRAPADRAGDVARGALAVGTASAVPPRAETTRP